MYPAIPEFASLVQLLQYLLEHIYQKNGKRTKRSVSYLNLRDHGWSDLHIQIFRACQNALAHQVNITQCDQSQRLSIYTDAFEETWRVIYTCTAWKTLQEESWTASQKYGVSFLPIIGHTDPSLYSRKGGICNSYHTETLELDGCDIWGLLHAHGTV